MRDDSHFVTGVSDFCHLLGERQDSVTWHVPTRFNIVVGKQFQHTVGSNIGSKDAP